MKTTNNVWEFPSKVGIETSHQYLTKLKTISHNSSITFDLSKTESIHSSFVGFLIHAKQAIMKEGGKLVLDISPSLEKIFKMLKINDYLT